MIGNSSSSYKNNRPDQPGPQTFTPDFKQMPSFFELLIHSVEYVPQPKIVFNIEAKEYTPESQKPKVLPLNVAINTLTPTNGPVFVDLPQKYSIEEVFSKVKEFNQFEEFKKLGKALNEFSHRKVQVFKVFGKGTPKKGNKHKREFLRTEEFKPNDIENWRKGRSLEEEKIRQQSVLTTLKLTVSHEDKEKVRRKIKATLNKLSLSNVEKLQPELATLAKDSKDALSFLIENVFEKAWAEPKYTEMYATLCQYLKVQFTGFLFDGESPSKKNLNWFRYILLNHIQVAFEDSHTSDKTQLESSLAQRRKKSHGSVRFIGELLKVRIISPKMIQYIVETLLALNQQGQELNQEKLEVACVMISTMGVFNEKAKLLRTTNVIFEYLANTLNHNSAVCAQVKFKIMVVYM